MNNYGTILLLEDEEVIKNNYFIFLETIFTKILHTTNFKDAIEIYTHYKPNVIIVGNGAIKNKYDKFLKKILNTSVKLFLCCNRKDKRYLEDTTNYDFKYCELPTKVKDHFLSENSLLSSNNDNFYNILYNKDKRTNYLNHFYNPAIICTKNMDFVDSNDAFNDFFDISKTDIKISIVRQEFINRMFLKDIVKTKSLLNIHSFKIINQEIKGKIFLLQNQEIYLIVFPIVHVDNLEKTKLRRHFERTICSFNSYSQTSQMINNIREGFYNNCPFDKGTATTDEAILNWTIKNIEVLQYWDEIFNFEVLKSTNPLT